VPTVELLKMAHNETSDACGDWFKYTLEATPSDAGLQEGSFLDQPLMGQGSSLLLFGGAAFTNAGALSSFVAFSYPKNCAYNPDCQTNFTVFHPRTWRCRHRAPPRTTTSSPASRTPATRSTGWTTTPALPCRASSESDLDQSCRRHATPASPEHRIPSSLKLTIRTPRAGYRRLPFSTAPASGSFTRRPPGTIPRSATGPSTPPPTRLTPRSSTTTRPVMTSTPPSRSASTAHPGRSSSTGPTPTSRAGCPSPTPLPP
jgi:hypothetical protein